MNIFLLALLVYMLYRFIAGFLIPVVRSTRHMNQHFHDMNGKTNNAQDNSRGPGQHSNGTPNEPKTETSKVGEYIDFEEIH
jgi:hypothetical protein